MAKSYSTVRKCSESFTIDGKSYHIVELTGQQRGRYVDERMACHKPNELGNVTRIEVGHLPAFLLSMCLVDEETNAVAASQFVKELPGTVQRDLYQDALELNDLAERDLSLTPQLKELFDRDDVPVTWKQICEAAQSFEGNKYRLMRSFFVDSDDEEEAKNS